MMSIDAQIEELRAELKGSLDAKERAQIERELAVALEVRTAGDG